MTEPYWDPLLLNWEWVRNVNYVRSCKFCCYYSFFVHLTTSNAVKKLSYNPPMDVVAAIHSAKNKEKSMWPDVADLEP